jgi:hypothetical protein
MLRFEKQSKNILEKFKANKIITPTNAPKDIYNFILKNFLHVSILLGHLQGK